MAAEDELDEELLLSVHVQSKVRSGEKSKREGRGEWGLGREREGRGEGEGEEGGR